MGESLSVTGFDLMLSIMSLYKTSYCMLAIVILILSIISKVKEKLGKDKVGKLLHCAVSNNCLYLHQKSHHVF